MKKGTKTILIIAAGALAATAIGGTAYAADRAAKGLIGSETPSASSRSESVGGSGGQSGTSSSAPSSEGGSEDLIATSVSLSLDRAEFTAPGQTATATITVLPAGATAEVTIASYGSDLYFGIGGDGARLSQKTASVTGSAEETVFLLGPFAGSESIAAYFTGGSGSTVASEAVQCVFKTQNPIASAYVYGAILGDGTFRPLPQATNEYVEYSGSGTYSKIGHADSASDVELWLKGQTITIEIACTGEDASAPLGFVTDNSLSAGGLLYDSSTGYLAIVEGKTAGDVFGWGLDCAGNISLISSGNGSAIVGISVSTEADAADIFDTGDASGYLFKDDESGASPIVAYYEDTAD